MLYEVTGSAVNYDQTNFGPYVTNTVLWCNWEPCQCADEVVQT